MTDRTVSASETCDHVCLTTAEILSAGMRSSECAVRCVQQPGSCVLFDSGGECRWRCVSCSDQDEASLHAMLLVTTDFEGSVKVREGWYVRPCLGSPTMVLSASTTWAGEHDCMPMPTNRPMCPPLARSQSHVRQLMALGDGVSPPSSAYISAVDRRSWRDFAVRGQKGQSGAQPHRPQIQATAGSAPPALRGKRHTCRSTVSRSDRSTKAGRKLSKVSDSCPCTMRVPMLSWRADTICYRPDTGECQKGDRVIGQMTAARLSRSCAIHG